MSVCINIYISDILRTRAIKLGDNKSNYCKQKNHVLEFGHAHLRLRKNDINSVASHFKVGMFIFVDNTSYGLNEFCKFRSEIKINLEVI